MLVITSYNLDAREVPNHTLPSELVGVEELTLKEACEAVADKFEIVRSDYWALLKRGNERYLLSLI